ncbi:hypothetical protein Patl1_26673 [Pistacia atlantica]|uniref:Uncharacterized protein n=1 Tax=Pistacia atlantica TaxID=434234 RepID=A0ACC1B161_9ROSI|nr:hypothetical protein Patl1_26673 [Pistacia atlantica]
MKIELASLPFNYVGHHQYIYSLTLYLFNVILMHATYELCYGVINDVVYL